MRVRLAGLLLAVATTIAPLPSRADAPAIGHVVVARSDGDALLLWDASSEVSIIVSTKLSDDEANARLKRDAIRVLAASTSTVARGAKTITVRIVYNKTGAVSPVYGAATFAGVEHYAELEISGADFFANRDHWQTAADRPVLPAWLTLHVEGALPAR